jgi:hypothetical protein
MLRTEVDRYLDTTDIQFLSQELSKSIEVQGGRERVFYLVCLSRTKGKSLGFIP